MDIFKVYTGESYPTIVEERINRKTMRYIPYEISKDETGMYSWRYVPVAPNKFNYGGVIETIVYLKYDYNAVMAILSNYLLDPDEEGVKEEFLEFQNWRKYAKSIAREIFQK